MEWSWVVTESELITLIDSLRALPTETEWFEFKSNYNGQADDLGEYLSALANSASISNQEMGYLFYGIHDESHEVIGTSFDPYSTKAKGNQDLLIWLTSRLNPPVGFESHIVNHPKGRVVIFLIPAASGIPVTFLNKSSIRIGTSKTDLANHPEKERMIWMKGRDWTAEICPRAELGDLDPAAIAKAREEFVVKHPNQKAEVEAWDIATFLNKAKILKKGSVTNAAILLLGRPESATLLSPCVAKISWFLKDQENRDLSYMHFDPPFLLAGDKVLKCLRNLVVRAMPSGTLFPVETTQYDSWVIREALNNCIAHQDYGLRGRITVVEFPDRIVLGNVGNFLPGEVETVIRQDSPPAIYRNPYLADAMVAFNLIDTQGGGIKRMFETQRRRSFPMPDYDLSDPRRVLVSISGRILDESYTRLLMSRTDLSLEKVMLLDRVQKRLPITRDDHKQLKKVGLVEGRFPNVMVSGIVAKATGDAGRHVRERGFDKKYYRDLILEVIRLHQPVTRKEINEALIPKLPDRFSPEQKIDKVHNLMQGLRLEGKIINTGSRADPRWELPNSDAN